MLADLSATLSSQTRSNGAPRAAARGMAYSRIDSSPPKTEPATAQKRTNSDKPRKWSVRQVLQVICKKRRWYISTEEMEGVEGCSKATPGD